MLKSLAIKKSHIIILVFLLVAIYIELPLFFTATFFVPGFLTVFAIPLLIFINYRFMFKSDVVFLFKIVLVLLLSVFLSIGSDFIGHKLSGVAQTSVAIIAGILLLKEMRRLDLQTLKDVFFWLSLLLLVGTLLEVLGLLGVSDSFREVAYSQGGYKVYSNEQRDLMLAGFNRPKFFTSEPSLLAIGFFVFSTSWLILDACMKNWLLFLLANASMLYLIASPILFYSILSSYCIMWLSNESGKNFIVKNMVVVVGVVIVAGPLILLSGSFLDNFIERFSNLFSGADTYVISSGNIRIVFPYLTAIDALSVSPFFGLGISGKDVVDSISTLPINPSDAFGNNNLATLFIYMGLIGAFLFVMAFYQYLVRLLPSLHLLIFLVLMVGLSQMMGGFESPRFWGYIFIFIGVLHVQARTYRDSHA